MYSHFICKLLKIDLEIENRNKEKKLSICFLLYIFSIPVFAVDLSLRLRGYNEWFPLPVYMESEYFCI